MRNTILRILAFLLITVSYAQQQGFSYKALISDNGSALPNQAVVVQFTILENGATTVYQEQHISTTDSNGILIVTIGEGTPTSGTFNNVDWSQEQFLKVVIDTGNGLTDFGTTAFKAVPYAKYASKSDFNNLENIPATILDGDDDTQLTEAQVDAFVANNGYLTSEVDGSITNEIQNISLSGDQLSITNGNTVTLPTGTTYSAGTGIAISGGVISNTGDISSTNEIQNLSLNGNQLSISNGSTVTLPAGTNYSAGTGISISGSTITNTGDTNPNDDVVLIGGVATVNGNMVVTGELQNPTISGDADMKAYMYGWVTSNGTIMTSASSSGFTVERIDADNDGTDDPGKYKIVYNTSFSGYSSYIIQINLIEANFTPGFVNSYQWSGYCDVYTYNISGAFIDKQFSFIIYKK